MGTCMWKPEISASEFTQNMKNCSILHGKQKSKPKLYTISQEKKNSFGIFFSEPTSSVRTHVTDFHAKNILFHIK